MSAWRRIYNFCTFIGTNGVSDKEAGFVDLVGLFDSIPYLKGAVCSV